MESLQNHLLVAMPHLTDPSFNKSVIYICDNSPRGTMGLVVNRPMTSANVALILNALGMDSGDQPSPLKEIYYGGPGLERWAKEQLMAARSLTGYRTTWP